MRPQPLRAARSGRPRYARPLSVRAPARPRGTNRSPEDSGSRTRSPSMRCLRLGTSPGISASRLSVAGQRRAELRHRAEQALRVGVARRAEQIADRRLLHLAARIHHHHALGDFGDDAEIVGDQDDGGADAVLEVAHQVQDLRLDGHVERRGRLVGDQELRIAGERHGDHHALAHAAGELVRIFAHAALRLGDADQGEHLDRALLGRVPVEPLMQLQRLADLPADGQHRIEARHRLLEDHADLVAADVAHRALRRASAGRCPGSGSIPRSCRAAPGSAAGSSWR